MGLENKSVFRCSPRGRLTSRVQRSPVTGLLFSRTSRGILDYFQGPLNCNPRSAKRIGLPGAVSPFPAVRLRTDIFAAWQDVLSDGNV